jgi:hypothetical protein
MYELFAEHGRVRIVAGLLNDAGQQIRKGAKFGYSTVKRLLTASTRVDRDIEGVGTPYRARVARTVRLFSPSLVRACEPPTERGGAAACRSRRRRQPRTPVDRLRVKGIGIYLTLDTNAGAFFC